MTRFHIRPGPGACGMAGGSATLDAGRGPDPHEASNRRLLGRAGAGGALAPRPVPPGPGRSAGPRHASLAPPSPAAASGAWSRRFDKVPGVVSTTSGYAGGRVKNPTYEQVSEGSTGHAEVVQVAYDPARVSYEQLLEVFWRNVDPTDAGRAVLRPGEPVPHRDLLRGRGAEAGGRRVEARARGLGSAEEADRDRDRPARGLLPSGGLPPGLLQEEPGALHDVPRGVRPGPAARGAVGQGSRPWPGHGGRNGRRATPGKGGWP